MSSCHSRTDTPSRSESRRSRRVGPAGPQPAQLPRQRRMKRDRVSRRCHWRRVHRRPVPDPEPAGQRRHGRGLQGRRSDPGPLGRAQGAAAELSGDPERMSRFLHEARAASALNHPNILTIHEVGDHDGSRFLVSELVEGETLRERLARGPLTLREILDITIQAASALSAAHAASIVHRDIKPDNLMLRPDGYVKVLDFGVATFAPSRARPRIRRRRSRRRSRRAQARSSAPSPTCRRNRRAGFPSTGDRIVTASASCSTSS